MDRRKFMAASVAAGTAMTIGAKSAIAQGTKSNRAKFRMKYAPHFGMFTNSAGNDPIDQACRKSSGRSKSDQGEP